MHTCVVSSPHLGSVLSLTTSVFPKISLPRLKVANVHGRLFFVIPEEMGKFLAATINTCHSHTFSLELNLYMSRQRKDGKMRLYFNSICDMAACMQPIRVWSRHRDAVWDDLEHSRFGTPGRNVIGETTWFRWKWFSRGTRTGIHLFATTSSAQLLKVMGVYSRI